METPPEAVDLGDPPQLSRAKNPFRILALSGGGYRGLFTALVLADLEKQAGRPLNQVFDLIAGTSIGGIIATGLAIGVPASDIAAGLKTHGPRIFPNRVFKGARQLVATLYDSAPLRSAVEDILPDHHHLPFGAISSELLITAVSQTLVAPRLLGTGRFAGPDDSLSVVEALLSTSAAPTYFAPMTKNGHSYIDGGLIANAPDLVALTQTLSRTTHTIQDCWMASVGTVSPDISKAAVEASFGMGVLRWMTTQKLFDVTLAAQEQLAVSQCGQLLTGRYLRIDPRPSAQQAKVIALDKADKTATDTLSLLAGQALDTVRANSGPLLRQMLH